ncbi:tetratricopeptide repeat protein [Paenibacillus sp. FA6]|uniref:tetratricopeptide repeat protein n=1 Tax=Paenibacillus sp. FA6 TaxID=3413029 RepID=UPI003F65E3D2
MFQHVFAEMNDMLEEIIKHYPTAQDTQKQYMIQRWNMLKAMSDGIIEEWLSFEDKMGAFREYTLLPPIFPLGATPEMETESFVRGQGYFKLMMYRQSIQQFSVIIMDVPDSLLARMYIAMAHLHLEETSEALKQFQWILPLTEHKRLKAMIYNALGCIQVKLSDTRKAQEYFALAMQNDPTLADPLVNIQVCNDNRGQLQYGSQLISLN